MIRAMRGIDSVAQRLSYRRSAQASACALVATRGLKPPLYAAGETQP